MLRGLISQSNLAPQQYKLGGHICDSIFHLPQDAERRGAGTVTLGESGTGQEEQSTLHLSRTHEQGPSVVFFIVKP